MVYKRPRKTSRGTIAPEKYAEACEIVIKQKESIRSVATRFSMCHVTLSRYVTKYKKENAVKTGYAPYNKVFTAEQEIDLAQHCKIASQLYFGLTTKDLRKLAYAYAKANNLKYPQKWDETELASLDWYKAFMKRHPSLSVRRPEATSIARAMNFNKPNVENFFDKWGELLDRLKCQPQNIYNIDETGVTTTQKPSRVIAVKGTKQVGAITSQERGTLVTVCLAVNAIGNAVPPFFVFPRKNFQPHFVRDGPPGCDGSGNKSGWMQDEDFLLFMKHFAKFAKPSKENPVVTILDNHSSHINIPVIQYCKKNFISILSFPPHTSHKLQPLDRTVFGPLKIKFNIAADHWMKNHPGQRMSIYDLPGLVKEAFSHAAIPVNIAQGFACTGIWPYNKDIFSDIDFAPASVTDQPISEVTTEQSDQQETLSTELDNNESSSVPSASRQILPQTSVQSTLSVTSQTSPHRTSLSDLSPLPKAPTRLKSKTGRSKGKSAIYTDTPEKEELEAKKRKIDAKKIPKLKYSKAKKTTKRKTVRTQNNKADESSDDGNEDEWYCIVCFDNYKSSAEEWLQCRNCHKWAHSSCAKNDPFYICLHCLTE